MFRVCQTNSRCVNYTGRATQRHGLRASHVRARKQTSQSRSQSPKDSYQVDGKLVGLAVSVCSAIVALSACMVTAVTLRDAQHMLHEYDSLEEKVKMLEYKDMQHELVLNILVNELLKLRDIGIV